MNKRVLLAFVLILAMVLSSSCSLVSKDAAVDNATPVLEVAGQVFTKGDVAEQTQYYLDYNEYMYYYYYGMSYDKASAENIAAAQSQAIEYLTQMAVVDAKLDEYGFMNHTEEELAEIEASAKEDFQLYYDTIKNFVFYNTEMEGDELHAAIVAEMANYGYPDEATLVAEKKYTLAQDKLVAEMNKDITVSEEELLTEYEALVAYDKITYTEEPAAYGTALINGESAYYAPAGYRYVKHILLQFTEDDQKFVDELALTISEKQAALNELGEGEDATALTAELEMLQNDLAEAQEAAYANLQPVVDEILAKVAAGEDFDALIAQYNEDPGMTEGFVGYPVSAVSTDWVEEFQAGAMALANVGDVSGAVRSSFGVHIIKYQSDIAEGEIGLESVRDTLMEEMLYIKQNDNVTAMLEQWIAEANVVLHEKELK